MRRRDFAAGLAFAALMRGARGVRPFSSLHDERGDWRAPDWLCD